MSQNNAADEIVEGSDSINIGTDPGSNMMTDSNHHETAVDAVGSDDAKPKG